jgi:hypothetical protein
MITTGFSTTNSHGVYINDGDDIPRYKHRDILSCGLYNRLGFYKLLLICTTLKSMVHVAASHIPINMSQGADSTRATLDLEETNLLLAACGITQVWRGVHEQ